MPKRTFTIDQVLTMLSGMPGQIATLTAGLTPAQLRAAPEPGEWSADEVLAHLRACSDVWGDCIRTILAEDMPTIRAINPRSWIKRTDYREQEFHPSLQAFKAQRTELLAVLRPLTPEAWSRMALVTGAGRPLERTVYFYAQWLARHEHTHIRQFKKIIKTMSTRVQPTSP